jgi:branched-chain amino acid transport system substrate-binding protein
MMRKLTIGLSLATGLLFSLPAPPRAGAAEPIKFGFLHTLSGGVAQMYGIPDQAGVKIAIEEINAAGGVLGRPLEMVSRDDKLSPETAVREAKDLILNEKVAWIQGTVSSGVALAVSAYVKGEKVIFVDSISQSAAITGEKGHRYVFRVTTNTTAYQRSLASAVAKTWPGAKKIYIIGPDYEYGHRSAKDFMEAYKKIVPDAQSIGELWPKLGNKDFTPYVTTIMSSGADVVQSSLWGGDALSFIKTATPFGFFDQVKFASADFGNIEVLSKTTKDAYPKNVLGGSHYPWWVIDNPVSRAFLPKFKKATGMEAGLGAYTGYTAVYFMKKAIEKAGTLDTEKVVDALEGSEVDAPVGRLKLRACDHQAMHPYWVGIIKWDDKYPWPYVHDPVALNPPDLGYRTCDEIMAARKAEGE